MRSQDEDKNVYRTRRPNNTHLQVRGWCERLPHVGRTVPDVDLVLHVLEDGLVQGKAVGRLTTGLAPPGGSSKVHRMNARENEQFSAGARWNPTNDGRDSEAGPYE